MINQIREDYGNKEFTDEFFETIIQDITVKKVHRVEIDQDYGFKRDPKDWTNDGTSATDYQAKLNVYVK